jgi:Membrane domain of glycerophosphoryl diester phosphodiesterase
VRLDVRAFVIPLALGLAFVLAGAARAQAEEDLAERYAPVVRLVEQTEECGHGEPYRPSDIDAFLDEETVSLRGPWRSNDLVTIAPSADDLGRGLYEYNLDFPGNALNPGCDYERWARRLTEGTEPTVYAHVATEAAYPDRLALQYWLYYPFNDWNNLHEGDWEMIQLVFAASTPEEALATEPLEVGYSQHEGGEKADWGDEKLEVVDGTHPVVYPAAGSHANFFTEGLHLGRSAEQGVGCDDTTGPSLELQPVVRSIPGDPDAGQRAFPWIAFEGRWGERQQAFYNGPTGPNLKTQWTEPITWSEDWRDRSYAVPAGGAFGTAATDFFCDAVEAGSNLVLRLVDDPGPLVAALGVIAVLLIYLLTRTRWRPSTPLRIARRRSWGQTVTASRRLYTSRPRLFLGIGLVAIPVSLVIALLQSGLIRATSLVGISPDAEGGGFRVALAVGIGTVLTLLSLGFVQAASARAIAEIDAGREISALGAYRMALDSVWPLLGALAIAVATVAVLSLSIFLIPIAIWLVVRWALLVPVAELEDRSAVEALRRSAELVRREWLKVGTLAVAVAALAIVAGPLLGALLILLVDAPFELVNVVAGVIYAVAMPFLGIATTYIYYDTLVRERLDEAFPATLELPAEISP